MRFAGIDIGSRTIELVVVDEAGQIKAGFHADTGFDPITEAKKLVDGVSFDRIMATGYGRNLFEINFDTPTVTEIKAHGAQAFFPDSRAVLDIGGQDSKAISLFETGKVKKFEMNDRCTAGTGKFLEIMAKNPCMVAFLAEKLERAVLIPENPQFIGARGEALLASELENTLNG
jgi:activator of 2-hydroxyglutaryl-CoA dehydratase